MPAPKSSSGRSSGTGGPKAPKGSAGSRAGKGTRTRGRAAATKAPRARASSGGARKASGTQKPKTTARAPRSSGIADGLAGLAELLANNVIRPLDLVLLTRERIQATLDEAAERGRVTRTDANELVSELVRRGRQQTDDLLSNMEQLVGRGREQLESATRRARRVDPVDRLVRGADRARRTVGVGPTFPILGYGDLTAAQVEERLHNLTPSELRRVRDYERRHANRKSVLEAIERRLD